MHIFACDEYVLESWTLVTLALGLKEILTKNQIKSKDTVEEIYHKMCNFLNILRHIIIFIVYESLYLLLIFSIAEINPSCLPTTCLSVKTLSGFFQPLTFSQR